MIYIICRNRSEIKYQIPNNVKIIINDSHDDFMAEIAAWMKIYKDATENGYSSIGIYQARRAFHQNCRILTDDDYDLRNADCYVTSYSLNSSTIYSQFLDTHSDIADVLNEILDEEEMKIIKTSHVIYPHNMIYTTLDEFRKLMTYVYGFIDKARKLNSTHTKTFSFICERLITIFIIKNKLRTKISRCICFDKFSKRVVNEKAGIAPWYCGHEYVIVHYNTPMLTTCLIRSIRKTDPDARVVVFDNSDKDPLERIICDEYYDNTSGKIINFTDELKKYPNKFEMSGKVNNYGSAKHSMSVDWLCKHRTNCFILLDSDVLLKRRIDFSDDDYICISDTEKFIYPIPPYNKQPAKIRMLPYIAFINPMKMKENNIEFFDYKRCDGLTIEGHNNDTGTSFYEDIIKTDKELFKQIKYTDYVVHYGKGSYTHSDWRQWCMSYYRLWH